MKIPNIPQNNLTEEIKEIIRLCTELEDEYGEDSSCFNPPANDEEIKAWETEKGIILPEFFKEWLLFSDGSRILDGLANIYGLKNIDVSFPGVSDEFVVIGDIIGDGELLCFTKSDGHIFSDSHGEIDDYGDFKGFLTRVVIRILRKK